MHPTQPERRELLQCGAALALASQAGNTFAADAAVAPPLPGPAMTSPSVRQRTPGKPGDFNFLNGHWKIQNQRKRPGAEWESFDGEASCFSILGGICSVEELRVPARNFSGMGLRLLDVKQKLWIDHWVNAALGVVTPPGLSGSFEGGAGIFEADDEEDGKPVTYRGVWDLIGERSCRWQQGSTRDGGRTWVLDWSMTWSKVV